MTYFSEVYLSKGWSELIDSNLTSNQRANVVGLAFKEVASRFLPSSSTLTILEAKFGKCHGTPDFSAPEWSWWSHVDIEFRLEETIDFASITEMIEGALPIKTHIGIWEKG